MVETSKKAIAGVVTLTAFLAFLAGGYTPDDGTPYYCESRNLVCTGYKLSDTGKSCYFTENGTEHWAVCREGWVLLSPGVYEPPGSVHIWGNGCMHHCRYQGSLKSYDVCYCDNGQYAYAGELI